MLQFGSPFYLFLAIPLAAAAWFVYRRRVRQALIFSAVRHIPTARATWRTRLRPLAPLLYLAGILLAIIAASAQTSQAAVVTRNIVDFQRVQGLRTFHPDNL